MKNLFVILILSSLSFSLAGQAETKKKSSNKKKENIEQSTSSPEVDQAEVAEADQAEVAEPDLKKVGKYIKNFGWSLFGAVITLPFLHELFYGTESSVSGSVPAVDSDRFENFAITTGAYFSIFCILNMGAQAIKAGWELKK